ncbi:hypothetical protein PBCVMA1E_457L [Paramecium bursaria Chlorella virus MA1E]|nr:hypothetical protein PBCVMA1E_457L [Paramecium bursaria Chlorella virus MA1E]
MKVPKNSGLSAKAIEYIERFSTGCQPKTALKRIVEYRDECKQMYNEDPHTEMCNRIHFLGEARDYITVRVKEAENKKKEGPPKSAMPSREARYNNNNGSPRISRHRQDESPRISRPRKVENKNKINNSDFTEFEKCTHKLPQKFRIHLGWLRVDDYESYDISSCSKLIKTKDYYTRAVEELSDRDGDRITDEHEIKYILRFQPLARRDPEKGVYTSKYCINAVEEYKQSQEELQEDLDEDDLAGYYFHQDRIDALEKVSDYFCEIDAEISNYISCADIENKEYMLSDFDKYYPIEEVELDYTGSPIKHYW